MEEKNRFLISVIPLTRIPLSREQFFYYICERLLPAGTLVEIPFFRRKIEGVVLESKTNFSRAEKFKLKKITAILEENFLSSFQLELAKFISDRYFTPLGITLKMFLPKRIEVRRKKTFEKEASANLADLPRPVFSPEEKNAINLITTEKKTKKEKNLILGPSHSLKKIYFELIKKKLETYSRAKKSEQILLLVPDFFSFSLELKKYEKILGKEKISILHNGLSYGVFYQNWRRAKEGKSQLIIGTRQAVAASFFNLKMIIVENEEDVAYKQKNIVPCYDARVIAEKLAEIYNAKLILGSSILRVESYFKKRKKDWQLICLPFSFTENPRVIIADKRKNKWKKNSAPFTEELKNEMKRALNDKKQIILIANRQGMSAFSICRSCKTVLKCPHCGRALLYQKTGEYFCPRCHYTTSTFPHCPVCHGWQFENLGIGTQLVEREAEKIFPTARVSRVDYQSSRSFSKKNEAIWRDFIEKKMEVIVSTQMIANPVNLPSPVLTAIIDTDELLNSLDFQGDERAFSLIIKVLEAATGRNKKAAEVVVIQTYNPENFIIQTAVKNNFEKFYRKELKERKDLDYPPFSRLIKLVFQNKNKMKVDEETSAVYKLLRASSGKNIKIFSPHYPLISRRGEIYKKQIVLKIKNSYRLPFKIKKILRSLNIGWIIDNDPESVV